MCRYGSSTTPPRPGWPVGTLWRVLALISLVLLATVWVTELQQPVR
jgi:hypothetical protein